MWITKEINKWGMGAETALPYRRTPTHFQRAYPTSRRWSLITPSQNKRNHPRTLNTESCVLWVQHAKGRSGTLQWRASPWQGDGHQCNSGKSCWQHVPLIWCDENGHSVSVVSHTKKLGPRDPWVAQRFSACLWHRARSWRPGSNPTSGSRCMEPASPSACVCVCV